jgi:23S rRNA pseudouridine2605 synthase
MSTGVLLLTNDGDLTKKLTHPKHNKKKIYQVEIDKNLKSADFKKLMTGVELEDGTFAFDELEYVNADDKKMLGICIHYGVNRIVRRMFENLGYKVKKLDRVYFAGLTKKGLERGHWRFLSEKEISMLRMGAYE